MIWSEWGRDFQQKQIGFLSQFMNRKFGAEIENVSAPLKQLDLEELQELSLVVYDFDSVHDLEGWLAKHPGENFPPDPGAAPNQ